MRAIRGKSCYRPTLKNLTSIVRRQAIVPKYLEFRELPLFGKPHEEKLTRVLTLEDFYDLVRASAKKARPQ